MVDKSPVFCLQGRRKKKDGKTQPYSNYVREGKWPAVSRKEEIDEILKKEQLQQMTNAVVNKPAQKDFHCKYPSEVRLDFCTIRILCSSILPFHPRSRGGSRI